MNTTRDTVILEPYISPLPPSKVVNGAHYSRPRDSGLFDDGETWTHVLVYSGTGGNGTLLTRSEFEKTLIGVRPYLRHHLMEHYVKDDWGTVHPMEVGTEGGVVRWGNYYVRFRLLTRSSR